MLDKLSNFLFYFLVLFLIGWFVFFPIAYLTQIKINDDLREQILLNNYLPNFEKERLLGDN